MYNGADLPSEVKEELISTEWSERGPAEWSERGPDKIIHNGADLYQHVILFVWSATDMPGISIDIAFH